VLGWICVCGGGGGGGGETRLDRSCFSLLEDYF